MRVRLAYLVAVVAVLAGYWLVPGVRPVWVAALGLLSVAAIAIGVRLARPQRWLAWLFIAAAVLLLTAGDVALHVLGTDPVRAADYPGPPDLFYVASYLPLAIGLLLLGQSRLPSRDLPLLLDTIGLSLACSLVVWITLVRPAVTSLHLDELGKITAIASMVGYGAVLAASARVVVAWRANAALGILGAAMAAFLVADFLYGQWLSNGERPLNIFIDLGFVAFVVLCGVAALSQAITRVATPAYARHQLGPLRVIMLAVALLVAPTALLVEATSGVVTTGVAIALVSGIVAVLVLVRIFISARDYRRRADRERAIREASRALLAASHRDEALDGLRRAVTAMLPSDAPQRVSVVREGPDPALRSVDHGQGELVVPVVGRAIVVHAPLAALVELSPVVEALAEQTGLALQRIDLLERQHEAERERYFRTLVLTSDDVTVISREDGRIGYATPSATAMFGHDVLGLRLDDLVELGPLPSGPDAGRDGRFERDGRAVEVLVRTHDLSADPTVAGEVTTLRDVTAERELRRDLAYRASHDALTGLANNELFTDRLRGDAAAAGPRTGRAAILVDLDDFKAVNDTYGHQVGDKLLVEVARRITSVLRYGDLAARLGGDEFAVLLGHLVDVDAARGVAQRVIDVLTPPAIVDGVAIDSRASVGLAYTDRPGFADVLVREADAALYAAKALGKGRWREYRPGLVVPARQHVQGRRRLADALRTGAFAVHYQPIVELATGEPVGFEALIRLPGSDPPMSTPDIIATAEDTGLITAIGDWVLGRALADSATLNPPGTNRRRYVSVNVSARQVRQPDFVATVREHLVASGVDPTLLVLEITENVLMDDDDRAWRFLAELRSAGVRVAIDDFGTGFASLSYLRQPDLDIVKIDRSFTSDAAPPRGRLLLEALATLCRNLGLTAIAEGVQDEGGVRALLAVGCHYGQGFHYAPALPLPEASRWPADA